MGMGILGNFNGFRRSPFYGATVVVGESVTVGIEKLSFPRAFIWILMAKNTTG